MSNKGVSLMASTSIIVKTFNHLKDSYQEATRIMMVGLGVSVKFCRQLWFVVE